MKKLLAIVLAAVMVLSLAACGKTDDNGSQADNSNISGTENKAPAATDSLDLLNKIWATYAEDEKFAAAGGDGTEEHAATDAPGIYSVEDAAGLDSMAGFPEASIAKIDNAATLLHMMNANTFTGGAYHVKDSADMATLSEELKTNILSRRWMCGFPEKLVIFNIDDYIISAFGNGEIIELFKSKTTAVYDSAKIYCEEIIE